jgi:hypothetical protein
VELEELCKRVAEDENEHATKVMQLSWLAMEISDALVDLSKFPILDIPVHPKLAQDVMRRTVLFWSVCARNMPPTPVPGSETRPVQRHYSPRLSRPPSFFYFWCVCNVHIYISTYVNVQRYWKICALTFLHFCTPAAASWGS